MGMRLTAIIVALLAATGPVAAQGSAPKPAAKPVTAAEAVARKPVKKPAEKSAKKPGTAKSADDPDSAVDVINPASSATLRAAGWRVIDDPVTGARLGLPGALVPRLAASRMGSRWMSKQG